MERQFASRRQDPAGWGQHPRLALTDSPGRWKGRQNPGTLSWPRRPGPTTERGETPSGEENGNRRRTRTGRRQGARGARARHPAAAHSDDRQCRQAGNGPMQAAGHDQKIGPREQPARREAHHGGDWGRNGPRDGRERGKSRRRSIPRDAARRPAARGQTRAATVAAQTRQHRRGRRAPQDRRDAPGPTPGQIPRRRQVELTQTQTSRNKRFQCSEPGACASGVAQLTANGSAATGRRSESGEIIPTAGDQYPDSTRTNAGCGGTTSGRATRDRRTTTPDDPGRWAEDAASAPRGERDRPARPGPAGARGCRPPTRQRTPDTRAREPGGGPDSAWQNPRGRPALAQRRPRKRTPARVPPKPRDRGPGAGAATWGGERGPRSGNGERSKTHCGPCARASAAPADQGNGPVQPHAAEPRPPAAAAAFRLKVRAEGNPGRGNPTPPHPNTATADRGGVG